VGRHQRLPRVGSYRAAARLCGTSDKTVKRALARRLSSDYGYRPRPLAVSNTEVVSGLVASTRPPSPCSTASLHHAVVVATEGESFPHARGARPGRWPAEELTGSEPEIAQVNDGRSRASTGFSAPLFSRCLVRMAQRGHRCGLFVDHRRGVFNGH
jgi:hypothetical protein